MKYKISSKGLKTREQLTNTLSKKLSEYFKPKKNISYERLVFHKSKQNANETILNYIVRLSKLAVSCEFTNKNEMIQDQVVNSCHSSKLRKKLLEKETLTLDNVKTLFGTFELSETHSKHMEPHATDDSPTTAGPNGNEKINQVRHMKQCRIKHQGARPKTYSHGTKLMGQRNKSHYKLAQGETDAIYYRCGEGGHYGKSCEKTKDVTCYASGKRHFAKMCK